MYFSTLGFATGENIQVFKSTDGGESFAAPVDGTPGYSGTTGEFQDKDWLTVDNVAGAGQGNVYLCWTRSAGDEGEIRLTRSTDHGASFGPSLGTLVSTGGHGCFVVVGAAHLVGPDSVVAMLKARGYATAAPERCVSR